MSFVRSEDGDRPSGSEQSLEVRPPEVFNKIRFQPADASPFKVPLLVEDFKTHETLRRIVSSLSADPVMQQDMLQECLVCLWKIQSKNPGRTVSWYLQHCRFHAQHWLFLGRSLDSPKRAGSANRITIGWSTEEPALQEYHNNSEVLDTV